MGIVADYLTGAADTAVQLTFAGWSTRLLLHPCDEPGQQPADHPDDVRGAVAVSTSARALGHGARDGAVDAVVTAPLNEAAMHSAGQRWPGHTELLVAVGAPLFLLESRTSDQHGRPLEVLTTWHRGSDVALDLQADGGQGPDRPERPGASGLAGAAARARALADQLERPTGS